MLINLLSNATKFGAKGEVITKVSLVEETEERCCVEVSVKDHGVGIKDEDKSAVFQEFTQLESPLTRQHVRRGSQVKIRVEIIDK